MLEIWRDVIGYEGLYEVSNLGRVRSWYDCYGNKRVEPFVLSGGEAGKGYLHVALYKDKKKKQLLVHRLVCEAFILGRKMKKGECVDHINTIRTDNRLENLRVCSHKENCLNPLTAAKLKGNNRGAIPLTLRGIKDGSVYRFKSSVEASRFFDYKNKSQIGNYISRALKNNKRTINLNGEEFYFSQAVK